MHNTTTLLRWTHSLNSTVYIDNEPMVNLNRLYGMQLGEIEEVYITKSLNIIEGSLGVIKIYTKKLSYFAPRGIKESFTVTKGFNMVMDFKNSIYTVTSDKGFENFGVINWIQTILPDENGDFKFQIPNLNQKNVKLLIEGFNSEGKIISEVKTLSLE